MLSPRSGSSGFACTTVTLLTPEPTGGSYREQGVEAFLRQFGYADKSGKVGRLNFGGIYSSVRGYHADTGLQLRLTGYDYESGKITDLTGGIALLDQHGEVAALWRYAGIIEHWNRKHAQAAYVPSLFQTPPPAYRYGQRIQLCEQTDLIVFLKAVAAGTVYYDPAIKAGKACLRSVSMLIELATLPRVRECSVVESEC